MTKRGRPPHPDILTPREWEVLALLREGLSNESIAGRLDITERTAKYHVSEILGKLGVSSREEAAAWQPEEGRPWWQTAGAPVGLFWRKASFALPSGLSSVALALSAGLFTVALGGLALMGFLLLRADDAPPTATVAPAGSNIPSLTFTPTPETTACFQPKSNFADVNWIDFVRFNGISYSARLGSGATGTLSESSLGPEFAKVRCKMESVWDTTYRTQDGDAAFLEPGTPVYTIQGYDPAFRLAARSLQTGQFVVYEADTNPKARVGADLLDIGGKVQYISMISREDGETELGAISDPDEVASLVAMVLAAPVDQSVRSSDVFRYFIAFHLEDGTTVGRAYWPDGGLLSRGIMLPEEFRTAIEGAVQANP